MTDTVSGRPTIDTFSDAAPDGPSAGTSPSAGSLRVRLRDETREAHEQLDASFTALANGDRRDYALFLAVNAACLAAIEPLLANGPLVEVMPDLDLGPRRKAAEADLETLRQRRIAPPPFPIERPTLAEALGIAYVIEGSRLGARMILKQLRKNEGAEPSEPFTTFFLQSAEGPERFRDFLKAAETLAATPVQQDAAVAAAEATFGYFLDAVRRLRAANHDGGAN